MNYYERLKEIQESNPALTFDNIGYQYIKKSNLSEDDLEKWEEIEQILKETVEGFVRFNNFKPRKDGTFDLRYQAHWDKRFVGVCYTPMERWKPENLTSCQETDQPEQILQ